jgi:GT2 family glycosyltransferase
MSRERQNIILHIGHGRTGSSSIQSSLALSVERLREAGIEYPELTPFARAKRGGVSSGNLGSANAFVQTITEVSHRHATANRLLFSSEWLFSRIAADGETLATLQNSFDVTVVLFTREFLAHAISAYGQKVKRGGATIPVDKYLAEDRWPHRVLQVLQAVERAGCRIEVFNYSRHSDRLLDVFAGAIGVARETLTPPPVSRVGRSLDEAELALVRRFNAVLGTSSGELVADLLCDKLPLHATGTPRISRKDYDAYRARVAPMEATINRLLPPAECYGAEEPVIVEDEQVGPNRLFSFSEAQLGVIAQSLGNEIVRLRERQANRIGSPGVSVRAHAPPKPAVSRWMGRCFGWFSPVGEAINNLRVRWVLARSPLFDAAWYERTYPDVKAAGFNPISHYIRFGANELRDPSSQFDTSDYLTRYPDVRAAGFNPLYHYIRYGRAEGREISRSSPAFDEEASARWVASLRSHPAHAEVVSSQPLVSIILPTKDRAAILPNAIRSVLAQTWTNWELLVVDDGSEDGSADMVRRDFPDPRIKLLLSTGRGVSAARNCGLAFARGDFVAYLDSDNTWTPLYLELMLAELERSRADAAYAVLKLFDSSDQTKPPTIGYRQRPFDHEALRVRNFIDINVFMHRRSLYEQLGGFDITLQRMVDWDLVIRYAADRRVSFAHFVGCNYSHSSCPSRITNRESISYLNVVRNKHMVAWDRVQQGLGDRDRRLVSIIICNFDKADLTRLCIESLYRHEAGEPFEVILVENGSNPQTLRAIEELVVRFPGVRLIRNLENFGFALGNNIGFAESRGSRVVFLNNDTEVTPEWLRSLVRPLENPDIQGAQPRLLYPDGSIQCAGLVFPRQSPLAYPIYAGEASDFGPTCRSREYQAITGACLAMRAEDFAAVKGFDPRYINGQEDVDLCLRIGRGRKMFRYVADSVVVHHEGRTAGRGKHIQANRQVFRDRWKDTVRADDESYYAEDGVVVGEYLADNPEWADAGYAVWRPGSIPGPASPARGVFQRLKGRTIAIKVPCPRPELKEHWGDYHFAVSLAAALFRQGVPARIDFLQDWHSAGDRNDVNLILRGLSRFAPVDGSLNFMWMISHPDKVSMEELQEYDGVFVASAVWTEKLRLDGLARVKTLLQCTDACRFHPDAFRDALRTRNLFVANSRRVLRPIVRAALEENIPLDLYGEMWEGLAPSEWIRGEKIDNVALAGYYASAEVVLNDHWDSMRECGFVSNRVFDVLACGGSLVTDRVVGLPPELADACHFFDVEGPLRPVLERARRVPGHRTEACLRIAEFVRQEHSFDARAAAIIKAMDSLEFRDEPAAFSGSVPSIVADVKFTEPKSHSS